MKLTKEKYKKLIEEASQLITKYTSVNPNNYSIDYNLNNNTARFGVAKIRITATTESKRVFVSREIAKYHTKENVINVIIHETFHIIAKVEERYYGIHNSKPHGGKWRDYADEINLNREFVNKYGPIKTTYKMVKEQHLNRKYVFECSCGAMFSKDRNSRYVKEYYKLRCKTCKKTGKFEQIKGPKVKIPKKSKNNPKTTRKEKLKNIINTTSNYLLKCIDCGKEYPRDKKSKTIKHPEKYRCKCGSKLSRIR